MKKLKKKQHTHRSNKRMEENPTTEDKESKKKHKIYEEEL